MKSNSYEILFILKTTFSEEERNKISETYKIFNKIRCKNNRL